MNVRSRYFGQTPEQVADGYFSWLFKARIAAIACIAGGCLMAIVSLRAGEAPGFFFFLLVAVAASFVFKAQASKRFLSLREILGSDCDPHAYGRVMELIGRRDTRGRSANVIATESALACYHADRALDALRLLSQVSFSSPKNAYWPRVYLIEAMARQAAGDTAGRDAALARLDALRLAAKPDSAMRNVLDECLVDYDVQFRAPAQWGEGELAHMRARAATADTRVTWVSWRLCEAEYAALHGQADEARMLLDAVEEGPLTPVAAARVSRVRALL